MEDNIMFIKELPVKEMKKYMSIFSNHGKEVPYVSGSLPVELDVNLYASLEEEGLLSIIVAFTDDGDLAGYMVLIATQLTHHKGKWAAMTDAFYVVPEYRGSGVFKLLVSYAEDLCRRNHISTLFLTVNSNFKDAAKAVESVEVYTESCVMYAKEF